VTRLATGIYCGSAHTTNPVVLGEALNRWVPRGAVTGQLALHLYAPRLARPERSDYAIAHGLHLEPPAWARLHQVNLPRTRVFPQGIACLEMPRALLDAWRFAAPAQRRDILWAALWARVCTWKQLAREAQRTPRIAGRRDLERLLGWFSEGATTPLEVRAKHEAFADPRFHEFEWQAALALPSRRVSVDMLHRRAGVVVELDGDRYHSTRDARDKDRERHTDLTAAGFVVLRFGWNDITRRPGWCRERVLATVAARLASG